MLSNIRKEIREKLDRDNFSEKKNNFVKKGQIPWSEGYIEYKLDYIKRSINDKEIIKSFAKGNLDANYGYRLDERVIEYPWIISRLPTGNLRLLDAGSTFNFDYILNNNLISEKDITIYTFSPESESFNHRKISYVYGDLRDLPFKDNLYDLIVSQSTIEHIDMDNSLYGYDLPRNDNLQEKSYEYLKAVNEMVRVLNFGGTLILTFPFGKFENHGFFQQFDESMLNTILSIFSENGVYESFFFKYESSGWRFADLEEVIACESFNPHTGKGKKDDFAAHSRAIACLHFTKKEVK